MAEVSVAEVPAVSVSLVTFNGERWLPRLLETLAGQTLSDYELLVVDNASTDATAGILRTHMAADARASVWQSERNLGFAAAHNRNIEAARGEFVLLLNQDVELSPGFLAAAAAAFGSDGDIGAVQGRLRVLAGPGQRTARLDSTGLVMHRDRRVVARRQGEEEDEGDLAGGYVWGADGPAPVYRRDALLGVREPRTAGGWEVLDEDFFMYKEDVDLAWRLRRDGWRAWYEPTALAWHARGAGGGRNRSMLDVVRSRHVVPRWIQDISWRNHRLMQIKNERLDEYVVDLPWILRRELASLAFIAILDPRRLAGLSGLLRLLGPMMRKRAARTRRR